MFAGSNLRTVCLESRPIRQNWHFSVSIGYRQRVPSTNWLIKTSSREGTSEGHQAFDHFEATSPLMFRQRELFNILVSDRRLIHRELHNKRQAHKGIWHGIYCYIKESGELNQKVQTALKLVFKKRYPTESWIRLNQAHISYSAWLLWESREAQR